MSDVRTRVIVEDQATAELRKIDREFEELGEGGTDAGDGLGEFADGLSVALLNATLMIHAGQLLFDVLGEIYKAASEGAKVIGGETAAAYEEFDRNAQAAEESLKGLLARGLLPLIEAQNQAWEAVRNLDQALKDGIITQQEYNQAIAAGQNVYGDWVALSPELNTAIKANTAAIDEQAEAVRELTKAELAHIQFVESSWDKAMLASAGLIESKVSAALIAQREEVARANAEWALLAQQIAGPVGKANEQFLEQSAQLRDRTIEIREEIAALGGLEYLSDDQQSSILELRSQLIGVAMEIHDIEDAYGDAFAEGRTGRKVLEAKERLEELRGTAWELEQQIISLGAKPYTTAADLEDIDALQKELGETEAAIRAIAVARQQEHQAFLLNMLQQQLAVDGLTTEEVAMLNDIALAWGLIDQETRDAQNTVLAAALAINSDANLDEIMFKLGFFDGTHTATLRIEIIGQDLLDAAADDIAAMTDTHQGLDSDDYGGGGSGGTGTGGGGSGSGGEDTGGSGSKGGGSGTTDAPGLNLPDVNIQIGAETIARITGEQLGAAVRQAIAAGAGRAGV